MCRDVAGGQTAGIQRQHDLIDAGQSPLPLGHDHRLEAAVAVPRYVDGDLTRVGEHLLARCSAISSSKAVSSTVLVSAFNNPPGPVNATCWARACRTNSLAAASSSAEGGSAGSLDGGGLTPTNVSVIATFPAKPQLSVFGQQTPFVGHSRARRGSSWGRAQVSTAGSAASSISPTRTSMTSSRKRIPVVRLSWSTARATWEPDRRMVARASSRSDSW